MTPAGLPHSEIPGSKRACRSPRLIAACCVLHRLSVPRHPPSTLSNLTIKCLDLMRSAVESQYNGFDMHLFNYNPYSIVNEPSIAKIDAGCNLFFRLRPPLISRRLLFSAAWMIDNRSAGQAISAQPFQRALVELIGIEPTTPCLQSRCSPS